MPIFAEMKRMIARLLFGLWLVFLMLGCKKNEYYGCDDPSALNYDPTGKAKRELCRYPMELTQNILNNTRKQRGDDRRGCSTNTTDRLRACFAETDKNVSADSSLRKHYVNYVPISAPIQPGIMVTQHLYHARTKKLVSVYGMFKQPTGYFPEGGDWEYVILDPATVKDSTRKNGILPPTGILRGKLAQCAICHRRGANNYLFNQY
jgi:hypothetical protein